MTHIASSGQLSLVNEKIQRAGVITLLRLIAGPPADVRSASALAGDDVARVLVRAAGIAFAGLASVAFLGESPVIRQTLIAVARGHVTFARAFAGHRVAALIVDGAERVAGAGCKSRDCLNSVSEIAEQLHYLDILRDCRDQNSKSRSRNDRNDVPRRSLCNGSVRTRRR